MIFITGIITDISRFFKLLPLVFILFLSLITNLNSEDKYGLTIGGSLNKHLVNFSNLPDVPSCCPKYTSGAGLGYFFSLFYSFHIANFFELQSDLGFLSSSSSFISQEIKPVRVGNDVRDGIFEHSIKLDLNSFYFSPTAYLKILNNFRFGTGFWLAYSFSDNAVQKEQIISPDGIVYENGRKIRDEYNGKIPEFLPIRFAFTLNLDYELPISIADGYRIIPRLSYYYDVVPIVKNYNWSTHYINLSLSIYYKPELKQLEIKKETIIELDTLIFKDKNLKDSLFVSGRTFTNILSYEEKNIKITREIIKRTDTLFVPEKRDLIAKIQTFAIYPNEPRKKIFAIKVTENYARSVVPLLPFIFFERNSFDINEKYHYKGNIDEVQDYNDPVHLNRHIFKIIAQRIKENPETKIQLVAYSDKTSENADCKIAEDRAIAVRNYFVENFHIDASIFEIVSSGRNCEPKNPTLSRNEDGYYENRRVEIEPYNPEILKPLSIITRLNAPHTDPPALEFDPNGTSMDNVSKWKLEIFQKNTSLLEYIGTGTPKTITQDVDSVLAQKIINNEPLTAKLTIWNDSGDSAMSFDSQEVVRDTADMILERYSVALFKVSKDILREIDKIGIRVFADKINNGDTISITGFTDYLGSESENIKLSQKRADAVYQFLAQILAEKKLKVVIDKCIGVADKIMPSNIHSYSTPEERYLSRTVQIEIKK